MSVITISLILFVYFEENIHFNERQWGDGDLSCLYRQTHGHKQQWNILCLGQCLGGYTPSK